MDRLKRIFCLFLALVFLLTAPGVMPVKTEANAAVADSGVLSLALLFATWAGVTFNQSDQAVTAMQNFLTSKAEVASTINSLIGKNIILGTTDLLLTGDLRAAFSIILPHIRSFFQTESETVSSSNSGSLVGSCVVGAPLARTKYDGGRADIRPNDSTVFFSTKVTAGDTWCFQFPSGSRFFRIISSPASYSSGVCNRIEFCGLDDDGTVSNRSSFDSRSYGDSLQFGVFDYFVEGVYKWTGLVFSDLPEFSGYNRTEYRLTGYENVSISLVSTASDSIPFETSKVVNGSASLGALEAADLDESDKVYPIAPVTKVVSSGLAGSTTAPGLSAEEYEKILADVLASTAVIPTTPQPTTAEPEP